jgi:HEAT repeat protein
MIEIFHATEPPAGPFDAGIVAAAVQIGSSSRDAETREYAWFTLRGVDDAYVVQPLLHSLANDPAENVRRAAALALGYLVDEPGVRDGLTRAAAYDPSPEVAAVCCLPTVREAARYALLTDEERRALALQTVLDEGLPAEQRLRPYRSSIDGRHVPLTDDAAQAVFDLGAGAADAVTRASAWHLLAAVRNPAFKPTLLEDLASHASANVRVGAAFALGHYREDPAVRAALERALDDPSRDVQREAREALARDVR